MAQLFSPPDAPAAAARPAGGGDHCATVASIAYPTDSSYALGCRVGERRRSAAHPACCAASTMRHHLTLVLQRPRARSASTRGWTTGSSASFGRGRPGSYTFLLPATPRSAAAAPASAAQHHRRAGSRSSGRARAARGTGRADPVVDADPAGRDGAAERRRRRSASALEARSSASSTRARVRPSRRRSSTSPADRRCWSARVAATWRGSASSVTGAEGGEA